MGCFTPTIDLDVLRSDVCRMLAGHDKRIAAMPLTPDWAIDAIAHALSLSSGEPIVLDAGSGDGRIAAALSEINPRAEIIGVDKDASNVTRARERGLTNAEFRHADFLTERVETFAPPNVVIANPPEDMRGAFVRRAFEVARRDGVVAVLTPLSWLGGPRARACFPNSTPYDLHILGTSGWAWAVCNRARGAKSTGRWFQVEEPAKGRARPVTGPGDSR